MSIVQLDKNTIEKIAAGEVIESPLSIVKELIENSIDANAKNIVIEIKNGGKSYIRVTDDGMGIEEKDLKLAFARHATSKISKFDDLYKIFTLGFRGEALSSILACADISLITKTRNSDIGKKLIYKNNRLESQVSIATNVGTSIEVYDIFKNIPVRRKFLASDLQESNKISRLVHALALGYEGISFKFIKDERLIFHSLIEDDLKTKIKNLIDDNIVSELIPINFKNDIYEIKGYISNLNYYRGNRSLQYIFVNSRLVEYKNIGKTIENAYSNLIPNSRYPAFFVFIDTESKNVDINIHPNKKEIKLIFEEDLLFLFENNIANLLHDNSSSKKIRFEEEKQKDLNFYDEYSNILNSYNNVGKIREENDKLEEYNNLNDFFKVEDSDIKESKEIIDKENKVEQLSSLNSNETRKTDKMLDLTSLSYKGSIFSAYSIFEYENKLLLLSHRRAEQKIKFERYVNEFTEEEILVQQLLTPLTIKINIDDYSKYLEKKCLFKKLGFEIEEFSSNKLIIRAVPLIFETPENINFFYELLDLDYKNKNIFYDKISKIINNISFKKGDKIDENEALELLTELNKLENPYRNYEGKPIIISIEESELEKYFER